MSHDEVPFNQEWLGPDEADPLDRKEDLAFEHSRTRLEILNLVRRDFENVVRARQWLKWPCLGIVVVWLLFVGIVVGLNKPVFELSNSVLIALLSSASAQVIGLFLVVATHVFPRKGPTLSAELIGALDDSSQGEA